MREDRFHPLSLNSLKDCYKDLTFDLYLQMPNGKYLKAFDKETGLDFARLANYESKGVQFFFAHPDDVQRIDEFLSRSPLLTLQSPETSVDQKKKAFFAVMEQTLCEAFSLGTFTQLNVSKSFEALRASLAYDHDFLSTLTLLLRFCPKDDFFLKHAITTAVYSYVAAQLSGLTSERSMKIILFASLFHDLGKMQLPENRRFAHQNRTPEEIAEYRRHPVVTVENFETPLPFADEEIRTCILQHRERLDGKGYPLGLKGTGIFGMARIIAIGDGLSELTLGMEDGHPYTRPQAIAMMMADEGHYDKKILAPFAQHLMSGTLLKAG